MVREGPVLPASDYPPEIWLNEHKACDYPGYLSPLQIAPLVLAHAHKLWERPEHQIESAYSIEVSGCQDAVSVRDDCG